ncbi:UNVERIFIED_CONTAM: hypothetical protein K2H54_058106 [Gekko kuhli]
MQPGPVFLSNRYAVLEEDLPSLSGAKERNSLAEISTQQQCCQQLSFMIMELFSKEAILTSQSLALLLDKINAIDVKTLPAPQLLPPIDVEMDTEQSETGTSAVNVDCPQTSKNGSVFFIGIGY